MGVAHTYESTWRKNDRKVLNQENAEAVGIVTQWKAGNDAYEVD